MTIEEAIRRIKAWNLDSDDMEVLSVAIPELRESEDERIRKELLEEIEFIIPHDDETDSEGLILPSYHARIDRYKSYLEKQKEQTEDLSTRLNGVMQEYVKEGKDEEEQEHRLKCYQLFWDALGDSEFFKQKEQKPAEWSDTDNLMCNAALELLRSHPNLMASHSISKSSVIRWLQSFRPQKQGFIDNICSKAGIDIPYLDGNQWCILKGDNIQTGVVGFGVTKEDALANFIKDVSIPQQWSEEDKYILKNIHDFVKENTINPNRVNCAKECLNWLNSLPERFNLQPKTEWSEEDIYITNVLEYIVGKHRPDEIFKIGNKQGVSAYKICSWLKSLRP